MKNKLEERGRHIEAHAQLPSAILRSSSEGVTFSVKVVPRAVRSQLEGWHACPEPAASSFTPTGRPLPAPRAARVGRQSTCPVPHAAGVYARLRRAVQGERHRACGVAARCRRGDALKVRLQSPPVAGKANAALIALLAARLHIGTGQVEIISGVTSRHKMVRVHGLSADQIKMRLESK